MNDKQDTFTVVPFSRSRQLMVDGGQLGLKQHTVHGLVEFDITRARETLRQYKKDSGVALSFTAFFLSCLGKAIESNKEMHAYRDLRNRLVIFDEVDVNMLFEVEVDGRKTIRPHILRGVNNKSVRQIHEEIRAFQDGHATSSETRYIDWLLRLPAFLRRFLIWLLLKSPQQVKAYYGTVLVTSLGMFGSGAGWGIPVPNHTLQLTLGGIGEKPGVVNHRVEVRQYMSLTVSFNHDVVDGAPAARFIHQLKRLVEGGYQGE